MPLSNKALDTRFCRQNYYSLKSEMPPIIAVNTIRIKYLRKSQPITFQRRGGELKEVVFMFYFLISVRACYALSANVLL